jgi:hypothetical protein
MNDVLVESLQILQSATRVFQLDAGLTEFAHEQSGQIGHREIGTEVNQNDGLNALGPKPRT